VESTFNETKTIENKPLGGIRPGGGMYAHNDQDMGEQEDEPDGLSSDQIFRSSPALQGFTQDFPEEFNNDDDYDDDDDDIEISFDLEADPALAEMERVLEEENKNTEQTSGPPVLAISIADAAKAFKNLSNFTSGDNNTAGSKDDKASTDDPNEMEVY